jgi:hypothetical protein
MCRHNSQFYLSTTELCRCLSNCIAASLFCLKNCHYTKSSSFGSVYWHNTPVNLISSSSAAVQFTFRVHTTPLVLFSEKLYFFIFLSVFLPFPLFFLLFPFLSFSLLVQMANYLTWIRRVPGSNLGRRISWFLLSPFIQMLRLYLT